MAASAGGLLAIVNVGLAVNAFAANSDPDSAADVARCKTYSPVVEVRLAACDALLKIPELPAKTAALTYFYRGLAELSIERPDDSDSMGHEKNEQAALADLDAAIAHDPDFVAAYRYRANLHRYLHQYGKAVADIDKVIDAYPKLADLHALRAKYLTDEYQLDAALSEFGTAFALAGVDDDLPRILIESAETEAAAGHWEKALTDIDRGLPGLKTDHMRFWATSLRGRVDYLAGNYDAAAADLNNSGKWAKETDLYYLLWLFLTKTHKGQDAARDLWEQLPFVDTSTWPGPLLHYFAGDLPLSEITPPADVSEHDRKGALCEREFYLGEYALSKNQRMEALQHFQQAVDTGIADYVEYRSAQIELKRLKQ